MSISFTITSSSWSSSKMASLSISVEYEKNIYKIIELLKHVTFMVFC